MMKTLLMNWIENQNSASTKKTASILPSLTQSFIHFGSNHSRKCSFRRLLVYQFSVDAFRSALDFYFRPTLLLLSCWVVCKFDFKLCVCACASSLYHTNVSCCLPASVLSVVKWFCVCIVHRKLFVILFGERFPTEDA